MKSNPRQATPLSRRPSRGGIGWLVSIVIPGRNTDTKWCRSRSTVSFTLLTGLRLALDGFRCLGLATGGVRESNSHERLNRLLGFFRVDHRVRRPRPAAARVATLAAVNVVAYGGKIFADAVGPPVIGETSFATEEEEAFRLVGQQAQAIANATEGEF